jgi:hypothetical protein
MMNRPNRITDYFLSKYFLVSMLLVIVGCDRKGSLPMDIPLIKFEEGLNSKREVALSEIIDDIWIVKLETSEASIIGREVRKVIYSDNLIFISQYRHPLYVFNIEGEFVRTIGAIGRGPGELPDDYDFTFNKADSTLIFASSSQNSCSIYSINGAYLHDINLAGNFKGTYSINYVSNNLFFSQLIMPPDRDTSSFTHLLFNQKGEISNRYNIKMNIPDPAKEDALIFVITTPIFNVSSDVVHFYTSFNDTIFTIDQDGNLSNSLGWVRGDFNPTRFRNYLQGFAKVGSYWFFSVPIPENKSKFFMYDERDEKVFNVSKIINDIDGTLTNLPLESNVYDQTYESYVYENTYTVIYSPLKLKSMLKEGNFDAENIKYPERNRKFKDLVNSLDDNDNPIVAIFRLK